MYVCMIVTPAVGGPIYSETLELHPICTKERGREGKEEGKGRGKRKREGKGRGKGRGREKEEREKRKRKEKEKRKDLE